MNSSFNRLLAISCIVILSLVTPQLLHASPSDLVTNGGFETGDLTGWTFTAAASGSNFYVGEPANSGNNAAVFGAGIPGAYDTISQTLATQAGGSYLLNFYLTDEDTPSPDGANFEVLWDGISILNVPGTAAAFNYMEYTLPVRGAGSDILSFGGYNVDSFYALDDVNVAPTPEPNTFWLLGSGMLVLIGIERLRRRGLSRTPSF